jgi:hypothetical protein
MHFAARWPDAHFILESDCAGVVEKLTARRLDRSLLWPLIQEAIHEGRHLHRLEVCRITSREQNKVALELAHLVFRLSENRVYFSLFPECVQELVCKDIT